MSSPMKFLRAGARTFTCTQGFPRHASRIFYSTQAETASSEKPRSPDLSREYMSRNALGKTQWAQLKAEGSEVKVLAEGILQSKTFQAIFLRDVCCCPKCVDPNSTQKNFSTTDIPLNIQIKSMECAENGVTIAWENDILGFGDDHNTFIPRSLLNKYLASHSPMVSLQRTRDVHTWSKSEAQELKHFGYQSYLENDDVLLKSLQQLQKYGFIILNGVPEDERSVEDIAERIGTLRDTFYGRTWNVKSTPKAKNVAYTQQYLGLHMDLLYMETPPGFQFLHCLKNTCDGGSSLFSDSFHAAKLLLRNPEDGAKFSKLELAYHYKNDGHYYYRTHHLFEMKGPMSSLRFNTLTNVNYSPPFQAPFPYSHVKYKQTMENVSALKEFTKLVEAEENLFEYRLNEGECVIFNNRRVLHGRREFDSTSGERWLKGCYVDTDVVESRLRVLHEAAPLKPLENGLEPTTTEFE